MSNSENIFVNINNVAIENLKLKVSNAGIMMEIPAIDKYWVSDRKLNVYIPPPTGKNLPLGALDVWKYSINKYIEDLKWLLSLKYHIFWSNILHHSSCMDMLVSFLQEAAPPYLGAPHDSGIQELYNVAYRKLFIVFTRLVTNKESESEWMNKSYLGKILYDKYIFTIPILFDLCLLYGITNASHVEIIMKSVFTVQKNYVLDLKKAIGFLKQMFNFVALQIDSHANLGPEPQMLTEEFKGFSKSFGGLSKKSNAVEKNLTGASISDLCLHLSDCALTIRLFMNLYPPSRQIFRDEDFHLSITTLYENTIPLIYKKVEDFDETEKKIYNKIYEYLDIIRAELIDSYRLIIAVSIDNIFDNSADIENNVNTYLTLITDILSEKAFLKDYNSIYPVEVDLDVLCQAYDKMDPMKRDFILQAVMTSCFDDEPESTSRDQTNVTSEQNMANGRVVQFDNNIDIPGETKRQSHLSEVKDILPHLGDGFIMKCLEFYNYNTERVICGVLEGNLDQSLQSLDPSLPIIPEDPLDTQYLETGITRLNVFDNDEFDVMSRDNVDKSRIHRGKKKYEHKNLSEMLDDKSHIKVLKDKYTKYSLISDDVDVYDDEYDDTYDFEGPEIASDTIGDDDKRFSKNTAPHRLNQSIVESEEEGQEEDGASSSNQPPRDVFCANPEEVRAKYQARRDAKYGQRSERDVVGRGRGQGQDKEVLLNRRRKDARGGHNRRGGAQWKRTQGMMPS